MPRPKKIVAEKADEVQTAPKATKTVESSSMRDKVFELISGEVDKRLADPKRKVKPYSASLDAIEEIYKIPACVSTGLPSVDLMLMCAGDGRSWGIPFGRITEFSAPESSLKTTLMHVTTANAVKMGAVAAYISSEYDFDVAYAKTIWADAGLDVSGKLPIRPFYASTIGEMREAVESVLAPLRTVYDAAVKKGLNPKDHVPLCFIGVDSLAGMLAETNKTRLEKDWEESDKTGSNAKEIHDFFKFYMEDFAKLGVAFVFTNHLRANLGMGMVKTVIAHDMAVRYYCSLRMKFTLFNDNTFAQVSSQRGDHKYLLGMHWVMKLEKKRARPVRDEQVSVPYYVGFGFDYAYSLMDACLMSGVAEGSYSEMKVDFESILDEEIAKMLLPFLNKDGVPLELNVKEFKKMIKQNPMAAVALEELCYQNGPLPAPVDDPRG